VQGGGGGGIGGGGGGTAVATLIKTVSSATGVVPNVTIPIGTMNLSSIGVNIGGQKFIGDSCYKLIVWFEFLRINELLLLLTNVISMTYSLNRNFKITLQNTI